MLSHLSYPSPGSKLRLSPQAEHSVAAEVERISSHRMNQHSQFGSVQGLEAPRVPLQRPTGASPWEA
jgi:hypothetical protein